MAEYLATIAAGLWAGAAIYIAICEHPSIQALGVISSTEYFRMMSKRTAPLMMTLSAVGGTAGIFAWWHNDMVGWLVGGILLLSMFPLTAIVIVPTNLKLMAVNASTHPEDARQLHARWGKAHWLRTLLGTPAFLIYTWSLTAC